MVKTGIDLRNIGNVYFEVLKDYSCVYVYRFSLINFGSYVFVDIRLDGETDA